jgi:hypothetical protein
MTIVITLRNINHYEILAFKYEIKRMLTKPKNILPNIYSFSIESQTYNFINKVLNVSKIFSIKSFC